MAEASTHGRLAAAEAFLREAVYRSREAQAGAGVLGGGAGCGLGEGPVVGLELSPRGRALLAELDPRAAALDGERLAALRGVIADWVRRQDSLDRKRNHFLKDFRQRHGFDRAGYAPQVLVDYEAGLERVNGEAQAGLRAHVERLLALL